MVFHSKTGNTQQLADAVVTGTAEDVTGVRSECCALPMQVGRFAVGQWPAAGLENGYALKTLDRTFYEVEGKLTPLPYAMFISAGNIYRAVRAMERIANGYPFIKIQDPLIVRGQPCADDLEACRQLGQAMAMGIDMGIF